MKLTCITIIQTIVIILLASVIVTMNQKINKLKFQLNNDFTLEKSLRSASTISTNCPEPKSEDQSIDELLNSFKAQYQV